MVSQITVPDGTPMSDTYLGLHIAGTGIYGVGALLALMGVWVIASEERQKNQSNEIMDHNHYKSAPMWMAYVLASVQCLLMFISYCFDGTMMTVFGHEPPQFTDACGDGNYWYEIFWFVLAFGVIAVPTGVQAFRHCITNGVTSGLMVLSSLLTLLVVILRFQVKSTAFYWVSYVFVVLIYLKMQLLIVFLSNLTTTKGVFARVGGLMAFCTVGFLAWIALDMTFGFWQCIWHAYLSAILQFSLSIAFEIAVVLIAISSQSKNITELMNRAELGLTGAVSKVSGGNINL